VRETVVQLFYLVFDLVNNDDKKVLLRSSYLQYHHGSKNQFIYFDAPFLKLYELTLFKMHSVLRYKHGPFTVYFRIVNDNVLIDLGQSKKGNIFHKSVLGDIKERFYFIQQYISSMLLY